MVEVIWSCFLVCAGERGFWSFRLIIPQSMWFYLETLELLSVLLQQLMGRWMQGAWPSTCVREPKESPLQSSFRPYVRLLSSALAEGHQARPVHPGVRAARTIDMDCF